MNDEQAKRKQVVKGISEMLMTSQFTFDFVVKKKPKGIKIVCEVTQEQMDRLLKNPREKI